MKTKEKQVWREKASKNNPIMYIIMSYVGGKDDITSTTPTVMRKDRNKRNK